MNVSCILFFSASFGRAPTILVSSFPSLNSTIVGTPLIPSSVAASPASSTSAFAKFMSFSSVLISSNTGPSIWHGPHHVAQKSIALFPLDMYSCISFDFKFFILVYPPIFFVLFFVFSDFSVGCSYLKIPFFFFSLFVLFCFCVFLLVFEP